MRVVKYFEELLPREYLILFTNSNNNYRAYGRQIFKYIIFTVEIKRKTTTRYNLKYEFKDDLNSEC